MSGGGRRDCCVPDCHVKLEKSTASAYSWRYRICSTHLNASEVLLKGAHWVRVLRTWWDHSPFLVPHSPSSGATVRFCQKCSSW